jgi:hypothetical protein
VTQAQALLLLLLVVVVLLLVVAASAVVATAARAGVVAGEGAEGAVLGQLAQVGCMWPTGGCAASLLRLVLAGLSASVSRQPTSIHAV